MGVGAAAGDGAGPAVGAGTGDGVDEVDKDKELPFAGENPPQQFIRADAISQRDATIKTFRRRTPII
jgi:hypothetical protein